jgi:molecular chaperone IbpA
MTTLPLIKNFDKFFVGYEDMFDRISQNTTNYPPYNIIRADANSYIIEMALAGFDKTNVEVTLEGSKLTVKGTAPEKDESVKIFNGLALRPFTRVFNVSDDIKVTDAEMLNGLLKVTLEREVPETHIKKIEVK